MFSQLTDPYWKVIVLVVQMVSSGDDCLSI